MIDYLKGMTGTKRIALGLIIGFIIIFVLPEKVKIFYEDHFVDWTPAIVHRIVLRDTEACQGGKLFYDIHLDKYRDFEYTVKRQIVDSYNITYDSVVPPRKPLGPGVYAGSVYIPKSAEIGDWFLRWTVEYKIPPHGSQKETTTYAITVNSEKFWVVKCK
jgi:hypothetical protein